MYALDSDVLIAFLRNDPAACKAVRSAQDAGAGVTVLNMQEVLAGARDTQMREKIARFLAAFPAIPYTGDDVAHVVSIRHDLARRGASIGLMDEMIAGLVKANGLTLLTRNRKHFSRVKGLRTEPW